jgi:hypothetical protein
MHTYTHTHELIYCTRARNSIKHTYELRGEGAKCDMYQVTNLNFE